MNTYHDIKTLIDQWPSIVEFQKDMGCKYEAARQMRLRNSVAPDHWPKLVEAAQSRGIEGVTFEWLVSMRSAAPEVPTPKVSA